MRLKVFYGKRTFWLEEDASIFLFYNDPSKECDEVRLKIIISIFW
jgi:hypothetical protein